MVKQLKQLIPGDLLQKDTLFQCDDLPDLTQEEIDRAVLREKIKRATRTGVSVDKIAIGAALFNEIIARERAEKKYALAAKEYWAKVDKKPQFVKFTPVEMYQVFIERARRIIGQDFIVDEYNLEIIKQLCFYFTNTESDGLSLKKGILLMGERGCGKSVIMKAFSANQLQSYRLLSVRSITYDFAEHGFEVVKGFSCDETVAINHYGQDKIGYCFDDLGTEEERRHYGDKVNAMGEILLNRYDSLPHFMTHLTTNLNANALEQVYGARLRSRFREMFNVLTFNEKSPDRRK